VIFRLAKQFCSLSLVFEAFSTQIYTHSILSNLTFGGARYIATGRGFATTRIYFSILFSRFADPSIYLGMRTLIMLLYVTLTLWTPYLIYFRITVLSLCIAQPASVCVFEFHYRLSVCFFFFRVLDCILISILFSEFLRVCLVVTRVRITIRGLDTAGSRAPGSPDTIRRNSATHPRSYQAMSL